MKTHKLTLHCRNNDILFLRKDKYSKQACYTFKFHPEITLLLKLGCQQITHIPLHIFGQEELRSHTPFIIVFLSNKIF
jgi:hypothetical protein